MGGIGPAARRSSRGSRRGEGRDPPAALFFSSRDRRGEHPNGTSRVTPAFCRPTRSTALVGSIFRPPAWPDHRGGVLEPCAPQVLRVGRIAANARRGKTATPISPLAFEAVQRIDEVFASSARLTACRRARLGPAPERITPLVGALGKWMRDRARQTLRHADVAKAIDYMLTRWPAFTRFATMAASA